ncbi:hypothetical protein Tco_0657047, partial [Tanacetum coccineum]
DQLEWVLWYAPWLSDQLEWVLWYAPWLSDQLEWDMCNDLVGLKGELHENIGVKRSG